VTEALLDLDPPPFFHFWSSSLDLSPELRARTLPRISVPQLRERYERMLDCTALGVDPYDGCRERTLPLARLTPISLDETSLGALERTPYFEGPELIAALDQMEGTPVSARVGYVRLRLRALVFAGRVEEAQRRLATDGRVLSRVERLYFEAALLDAQQGERPELEPGDLPSPLDEIDQAFSAGCPAQAYAPAASSSDGRHVWSTIARVLSLGHRTRSGIDTARLQALLPRFTGHARQTLSLYIALGALVHRDRALFDRELAASEASERTLVGRALSILARSAFSTESAPAVEEDWIPDALAFSASTDEDYDDALDEDEDEAAGAEEADVDALPEPAATAYLRIAEDPEAAKVAAFLRLRPSDENTRRVQCDVAIEAFLALGPSPAFFGVPRTRPIQAALDTLTKKCVLDAPEGDHPVRALRVLELYADTLPERARASARRQTGEHEEEPDQLAQGVARALRSRVTDFMSLRLLGVSRTASLALEDRVTDARRALSDVPGERASLEWLLEDLTEERLPKSAAMTVIAWIMLDDPMRAREVQATQMLGALVDQFPRSKFLVWAVTMVSRRVGAAPGLLLTTRAEQLLRVAHDDVLLLRFLETAFGARVSPFAARVRNRVLALDPHAFDRAEADDCAP
jgi:hypothetical protein